jgi:hypothetical protein
MVMIDQKVLMPKIRSNHFWHRIQTLSIAIRARGSLQQKE